MALRDDIESFIATSSGMEGAYALISRCIAEGGAEGLAGLRRLAASDYGGHTYWYEMSAPAANSLLLFGEAGLRELFAAAMADPSRRLAHLAMELLASISAGSAEAPLSFVLSPPLQEALQDYLDNHQDLRPVAQTLLTDIVLSYQTDDDVTQHVGSALSNLSTSDRPAAKALFTAISARWLSTSRPVLAEYEELIRDHPNDEPRFQQFLTLHPHILDPLAFQVWPQPDFYGFKAPDYIVRRADDTYLVVEIECPGKMLITSGHQLSADTTHAVSQATDYDHYLMRKFSDLEGAFPGWDQPDLLVVCGLESSLNAEQRLALRNFNRSSRVRLVGFDYLASRARAITGNIVTGDVDVRSGFRLT